MTIEFGGWRLVPRDRLNWELEHRHAASRGKNEGSVRWHPQGRYYQHNTIDCALLYVADNLMKQNCREQAMTLDMAAAEWKAAIRELERAVLDAS